MNSEPKDNLYCHKSVRKQEALLDQTLKMVLRE